MNWISALLIQQSGSGAHIFVRVLKRKADTLNTNRASSLECCVAYNSIVYQIFLLDFVNFCLFVQRLYSKNPGGPVIMPHHVVL